MSCLSVHQLQGLYLVSLPGTALRVFAWRCGGPVVWRAAGVHDLLKLSAPDARLTKIGPLACTTHQNWPFGLHDSLNLTPRHFGRFSNTQVTGYLDYRGRPYPLLIKGIVQKLETF